MKVIDDKFKRTNSRKLTDFSVRCIIPCLLIGMVLYPALQNLEFASTASSLPSTSKTLENMTKSNITRMTTTEGNRSTNANAASPFPPKQENATSEFPLTNSAEIVLGAALKGPKGFQPNPVNVKTGGSITWTNKDTVVHTVTSGSGFSDANLGEEFDSGLLGGYFTHKFNNPGVFSYFCQIHPTMIGSVVVGR
ncbi:MAG TPA: plastocyanin/azurin family copper-binding protein [Nitrososphaeraceae archaeon]|jgi:plastocyanin|nr:plastocyanin/azurin family copper-binding protein [Nitrososphaeraceae archaeon]